MGMKNKKGNGRTLIFAALFATAILAAGFVFASQVFTAGQSGPVGNRTELNGSAGVGFGAAVHTIIPLISGCYNTATLHVGQISSCGYWRVKVSLTSSTNATSNSTSVDCCPMETRSVPCPAAASKGEAAIPRGVMCRPYKPGPTVTFQVYRYEPTAPVNRSTLDQITLTATLVNTTTLAPGQSTTVCLPENDNDTTPAMVPAWFRYGEDRCLTLSLLLSGISTNSTGAWATVSMRGTLGFEHWKWHWPHPMPMAARHG